MDNPCAYCLKADLKKWAKKEIACDSPCDAARKFFGIVTERTLEDIERDLAKAKAALEPVQKLRDKKVAAVNALFQEYWQYKLIHGLYRPMSDLKEYIKKEIGHIKLAVRRADGSLDVEDIYEDDWLCVDENGHLYYSSFDNGTMKFDEESGKYLFHQSLSSTYHDFVGFFEIEPA